MAVNQAPVKPPPTHHLHHHHHQHQHHPLQQMVVEAVAVAVAAGLQYIAIRQGIHHVIAWVIQMD
jgi:hypothetical protein